MYYRAIVAMGVKHCECRMYIQYVHCVVSKYIHQCIHVYVFEHRMHRVMSECISNWVFTVYCSTKDVRVN